MRSGLRPPAAIREILGLTRAPDDAPWIWLLAPGREPVAADIAPVTPPKIEPLQEASAALDAWDQIARDLRARAPQCLPEADLVMVGEVLEQAKAALLERDFDLLIRNRREARPYQSKSKMPNLRDSRRSWRGGCAATLRHERCESRRFGMTGSTALRLTR